MRTEWLRSNLPDSLTRGASAVCGYKLTSYNVSDKTIYARGVLQPKSECRAFFASLRSGHSSHSVCSANVCCPVLWKGSRVLSERVVPFQENPRTFSAVYSFLYFSMSSLYSSKWMRTMFSTKLERLLPLSPNLRTIKSARSYVSLLRYTAPPFGCSVWLEWARLACRLRAFPSSSWHWFAFERPYSLCSVQVLSAWFSLCPACLGLEKIWLSLPEVQQWYVQTDFQFGWVLNIAWRNGLYSPWVFPVIEEARLGIQCLVVFGVVVIARNRPGQQWILSSHGAYLDAWSEIYFFCNLLFVLFLCSYE